MANTYETKEAAFEAVAVAASMALRQGHGVTITVPGPKEGTESTMGTEP